jgi:hypothetical protein
VYVFANSPKAIIIAAFCSMAIIAFTYFVIVGPQLDTANKQVDKALQQSAPQINKAEQLQACINQAAGDVDKIQRCTEKYR